MKTSTLIDRAAKRLFTTCSSNGRIDDDRVRSAVRLTLDAKRRRRLAVLGRFERLVKLDRLRHTAILTSATPLAPYLRAQLEATLAGKYGPDLAFRYVKDPAVIGGVRVVVGSDVYDGTVRGALATLAERIEAQRAEPL